MHQFLKTALTGLMGLALAGLAAIGASAGPHGGGGDFHGGGGGFRGGGPGGGAFHDGGMGMRGGGPFAGGGHAGGFQGGGFVSSRGDRLGGPAFRSPSLADGFRGRATFARAGDFRAGRTAVSGLARNNARFADARGFGPAASRGAMGRGFNGASGAQRSLAFNGGRFGGSPAAAFTPRGAIGDPGRDVFSGWRGDWDGERRDFDFDGLDWDDFWPIGLGLIAFDWSLYHPYWGYWGPGPWGFWVADDWAPAYVGFWGPPYAPYGWGDAVWVPAAYPAPVAIDAAYAPAPAYWDVDLYACGGRHYVWDPVLGAYVVRRVYYPC